MLKGQVVKLVIVNSGEDATVRLGGGDVRYYEKKYGSLRKTIKIKVVSSGGIGLKKVNSESQSDFIAVF